MFAEAIANAMNLPLFIVTPADIFKSYVGESEQAVKQIFEELESCISVDESRADILPRLISSFLEGMEETDRKLFMGRYFHATPVK